MLKILVAEDDVSTNKLLCAILKISGYEAIPAFNGEAALDIIDHQHIDLLLYKLLAYPERTFTRMELLDEIWGIDSESDDKTVNVHINRLRNRFYDWPEFEIQTVRGLGYRAVKKV